VQMNWISIEKKLPPFMKDVLFWDDISKKVWFGWRESNDKEEPSCIGLQATRFPCSNLEKATHWMSLPDSPDMQNERGDQLDAIKWQLESIMNYIEGSFSPDDEYSSINRIHNKLDLLSNELDTIHKDIRGSNMNVLYCKSCNMVWGCDDVFLSQIDRHDWKCKQCNQPESSKREGLVETTDIVVAMASIHKANPSFNYVISEKCITQQGCDILNTANNEID
jgi:hypothetical protein